MADDPADFERRFRLELERTQAVADELVGLTEAEARAVVGMEGDLSVRVVDENGAITFDLSPHRVTLWMRDGRVVRTSAG
ncbi:hypothetical protein [uncultured Jatrophihabitans sp.]|uniref:hypothetical protein n=1 Tax=uncultured Jatrophihabitans sp. TaxID=1610747 RepID=UPI0035C9991B